MSSSDLFVGLVILVHATDYFCTIPARDDAVAQFVADPDRCVLVASLPAGGVGLNLTAASVVFRFDRWWNPAVETQAEDRAHRIGQTRPVQVLAYLTPDSIEQRIGQFSTRSARCSAVSSIVWQPRACAGWICRR